MPSLQPSRDRPSRPSKRLVSVLVVDDDPDTRELLAMVLEKARYSVVTAADGSAALTLLQTVRPALIFLDLQMPGIDGAHFREQQRHDPEWLRIPTIVLTGSSDEPQLDPAIALTLHKPVKAGRLLAIVGRYCKPDPDRPR